MRLYPTTQMYWNTRLAYQIQLNSVEAALVLQTTVDIIFWSFIIHGLSRRHDRRYQHHRRLRRAPTRI